MPGLVPGIHAFLVAKDVDGRDKPGHDDARAIASNKFATASRNLKPLNAMRLDIGGVRNKLKFVGRQHRTAAVARNAARHASETEV
jgi:hypothetical protein